MALFIALLAALAIVSLLVWEGFNLESQRKVFEVSVVIRSRQNSYWDAVKKGMDQAVSDMTVDLSYITLESDNDPAEQAAAILRELDNGARAIVVAPCSNSPEIEDAIDAARKRRANIIELEMEVGNPSASVLDDNEQLGKVLAEELLSRAAPDEQCAILLNDNPAGCIMERYKAFTSAMSDASRPVRVMQVSEMSNSKESPIYFAALDPATLRDAAHSLIPGDKLCGIGGSGEIAYFLENGTIGFAIADNAYSLGYVGIKSAVELLKGEKTEKRIYMDFAVITQENMYDVENQRMLFPFVK